MNCGSLHVALSHEWHPEERGYRESLKPTVKRKEQRGGIPEIPEKLTGDCAEENTCGWGWGYLKI